MLKDTFFYICFRIKDKWNEMKKSGKHHYIFQKFTLWVVAVLWAIVALNVLAGGWKVVEEEVILSAFNTDVYSGLTADVSTVAKVENMGLTTQAKKIILENIAKKIGLENYNIEQAQDDRTETVSLTQESVNGNVNCKFVSEKAIEGVSGNQYIFMEIMLNNSINSVFAYEEIIESILSDMKLDGDITVNLRGDIDGNINMELRDALANQMIEKIGAKIVAENRTEDLYTIYAYDSQIKDYIKIGSDKVNLNISISYDEIKNVTSVYFSTPINNHDY